MNFNVFPNNFTRCQVKACDCFPVAMKYNDSTAFIRIAHSMDICGTYCKFTYKVKSISRVMQMFYYFVLPTFSKTRIVPLGFLHIARGFIFSQRIMGAPFGRLRPEITLHRRHPVKRKSFCCICMANKEGNT